MNNYYYGRFFTIAGIVSVILCLAAASAFAGNFEAYEGFLKLASRNSGSYKCFMDESGKIKTIVSENISDYNLAADEISRETPADAAFRFAAENASIFGIKDAGCLKVEKISSTANITHVLFSHYSCGKKVAGSEIAVHVNAAGKAVMASNAFIPLETAPEEIRAAIAAKDAVNLAAAHNKCEVFRSAPRASEIIYPLNGKAAEAYRVEIPSRKPLGDFICVVSGVDGKILDNRNILYNADPLGTVYRSNPIKCKVTMEPLKYLKLAPDKKRLTGRWANVVNDKWVIIYPNEGDNYNYNATDSNFDEINAYYHTNIAHDYYFSQFGFTALDDRPIKVIVHFGTQQDNAFYSPLEHVMGFGDGRTYNSFAKEESIIYHEYSHAVTNAIAPLDYESESGAINEAFSDYFAATMTDDPETGEWLAAKIKKPYLRTLENSAHYPEDITDEVHLDSLILSGALWDLRKLAGAAVCDKLIHFSIYYLQANPSAKFSDAVVALIASDRQHFGGKYHDNIIKVMAARGIAAEKFAGSDIEKYLKFADLNLR
jgi:Zn-dependent metalloprotease